MWILEVFFIVMMPLGVCSLGACWHGYRVNGTRSWPGAIAVWAFYFLHGGLTVASAWQGFWPLDWPAAVSTPIGIVSIAVGVLLFVSGVVAFRSFERVSGTRADSLVTSGIYRYSRNPQNVGWGLVLLGTALVGRSAMAFAFAIPFWLILHLYLIFVEEPYLKNVYGDAYRDYMRATPRYLGLPREA